MIKPTKPSNNLPSSFGGTKEIFSADKISRGYEPDVPDILGGANLNYMLDTLGKKEQYYDAIADFINNIPIAKTITVNANNELVYRDWLGGRNFGELVYSSIPLSDSGLKLLDGSLIQGSGIYKNFVDYIASIVNTYSIIFTTEENWQQQVTTYGVCGKFVYDSTNNTVRLPKVTGIIEGTVDINTLGNIVQAGLPQHAHRGTTDSGDKPHTHTRGTMNIAGNFYTGHTDRQWGTWGAFYNTGTTGGNSGFNQGNSTRAYQIGFDAARTWTGSTSSTSIAHTHTFTSGNANNTIYKTSVGTVQPQTVKMFVYIVVANGIDKTDIELDIDDIVTDLNYKADIDLSNATSNISTNAKEFFTKLAFPSDEYIDLPLGENGSTYIAPDYGWVGLTIQSNATNGNAYLVSLTQDENDGICSQQSETTNENINLLLPVSKNQKFKVGYLNCKTFGEGAQDRFRFIYAKGAESEV